MRYTRKLEHLRASSLPKVVKNTLNSVAFLAKKTTIEEEYKKKGFEKRRGNFIKFASGVDTVKSNKVSTMKSSIGIRDKGIRATDDMKSQEVGGKIKSPLIASQFSRTSNSWNKSVKKENRVGSIPNSVFANKVQKGKTKQFMKAQGAALKNGTGFVAYGDHIFKVLNKRDKFEFNNKIVYSFKEGRSIDVKASNLILDTGISASKNMNKIFINHAKYELDR